MDVLRNLLHCMLLLECYVWCAHLSCTTGSQKKLVLNVTSWKNESGHWFTELKADYKGDTPRRWTLNVESLDTDCNGDEGVRLSALVSVPPPRPKDYEFFPGIGYYKFHTDLKNWDNARKTCEDEGGHLAILNSEEESEVLQGLFKRYPEGDVWALVGFHDRYKEGNFITIFGQPINQTGFTRWSGSNQPDDHRGNEDCGSIHRNGGLNDIPCTADLYFICEYELW